MATRMVIGAKTSYHFRLMMKKIISCKSFEMISTYPLNGPLYHVDQVPAEFQESFILSGYRHPKSTFLQCIFSVFYRTNETGNFWTHFLPACYFIYIICEKLMHDDYSLPFLAYLWACILFSLASSMAHMFFVLSDYARHICFFIDYGGLSLFSIGSAIAYRAYVFPEVLECTWFGDWYLPIAIFGALSSTFFSCLSRFKKDCHTQQLLRIVAFSLPYLFDNLPVMIWLARCDFEQCLQSKSYHIIQFAFCFIAAFLYMSHLPERLQPGRFDIWGHSHQIFHVCGILGTIAQMKAIEIDMNLQKTNIIKHCYYKYFHYSVGIMCAVLILNIIIIFIFSCMLKVEMKKKNDRQTDQEKNDRQTDQEKNDRQTDQKKNDRQTDQKKNDRQTDQEKNDRQTDQEKNDRQTDQKKND